MTSVDIDTLALRLLKLEQKLDSYATLYEEELADIESALSQLRQDLLTLQRERPSERTPVGPGGRSDGGGSTDSQCLAL